MSLSSDVLSRATPTRLTCRAGRWVLEMSRLEAVDRDVYQPRLTRLEGAESILAALRRSDEGQHLVNGTAQLMRGPRTDEDRAFEISDGDWVPTGDAGVGPRAPQASDADDAADTARALAELRAELLVLRASHSRLRERVMALEAAQSGISAPNVRAPRGSRSPRRRSEPPPGFAAVDETSEPLGNPVAFAATQASPGAGAPAVAKLAVAAEPEPRAAPAPSFEELAKSLGGEPPLPVLALPSLSSISDCLATLLGSDPGLVRGPETPFDSLVTPYVCKLLDDDGRERGAILLDLKAAVQLGAALLALPADEALRQVRENEPSEDVLLAMSEICNNLTGPVNAAGNGHVRSTALTSVDVSTLPRPRARMDLGRDGGHLVLAMF